MRNQALHHSARSAAWAVAVLIAGAAILSGCRQQTTVRRAAGFTNFGQIEAAIESELAKFGVPQKEPDFNHGPTHVVTRDGYILEHSAVDKIPLWVCERVKRQHLRGPGDRDKSTFKPDPLLQSGDRAELTDYKGSGYDRGNQAPAADFKRSQRLTDESFFLSNMAPQIGIGFNRHIWAKLEGQVRNAARRRGEVFIITGGIFYDPAEEDPDTADGIVEYSVIGSGQVAVPTHFYKIMVGESPDSGELEAIAFVLANRKYGRKKVRLEDVRSNRSEFHA